MLFFSLFVWMHCCLKLNDIVLCSRWIVISSSVMLHLIWSNNAKWIDWNDMKSFFFFFWIEILHDTTDKRVIWHTDVLVWIPRIEAIVSGTLKRSHEMSHKRIGTIALFIPLQNRKLMSCCNIRDRLSFFF